MTDSSVDMFDREAEFVRSKLCYILDHVPDLKVVLEHITTREAVGGWVGGAAACIVWY